MKWLKTLATVVVGLFIIVPMIAYGLISTTKGSKWLLDSAISFTDLNLTYRKVEGRLLDELTLKDIHFKDASTDILLSEIKLNWQPFDLLDKVVQIKQLHIGNVTVKTQQQTTEAETPIRLPKLSLPVTLNIEELVYSQHLPVEGDNSAKLTTKLEWVEDTITLSQLTIEASYLEGTLNLMGDITLNTDTNYPIQMNLDYHLHYPYPGISIDRLDGNLRIDGAIAGELQIESELQADNTPTQQMTADVHSLLSNPQWDAQINLSELPLSPFLGLLSNIQPQLAPLITKTSRVSGQLTTNSEQVLIKQLTVNEISSTSGALTLNGEWLHANFSQELAQQRFAISAFADNILLPLESTEIVVRELNLDFNGTPTAYEFTMDSVAMLSHQQENLLALERLQFGLAGNGDLDQVTFNTMTLNSSELNASATANVQWQPELAVNLRLTDASANLTLAGEPTSAQASGVISLEQDALKINEFIISFAGTTFTAHGTTAKDSLIQGRLFIEDPTLLPGVPETLHEIDQVELEYTFNAQNNFTDLALVVENLRIDTESFGQLTTTQASEFHWQQQPQSWQLNVTPLCFSDSSGRIGRLCAQATANPTTTEVAVTGQELALAILNRLREQDVAERIAGRLEITANLTLDTMSQQVRHVEGKVSSNSTVFFALDKETSTRLDYWEINAQGNAERLTATLDGMLDNAQGGIIGEFKLEDLYGAQAIDGSLLFSLDDLAMMDWVLPGVRYEGGKATASLNVTGTLDAPSLEGDMEVYAKTVGFAQTNLVFNDVRLALIDDPDTQGELQIEGQARSGKTGTLFIEGLALPLEQEAYLAIEGDRFRAMQMPTMTVDISPDIRIFVKDKLIDIAGTVGVPYASINAPEFENAVARSGDITVTEQGEPVLTKQDNLGNFKVNAAIRVNLGEDVSVNAYGFEGKLSGSLELLERPSRPVTAIGSISVYDSSYTLYGQKLNIEHGAFIYNGGDVGNPGLSLQVKRSITDPSAGSQVSVGAQVAGTLTAPDFRLFATPAMPDSEILSYLLLGRSMQSASSTSSEDLQLQALLMLGARGTNAIGESLQDNLGIDEVSLSSDPTTRETSFYIGKYLSPKLYVKYGIGLLESTNTFMIRYQLTERLLIETMTSTKAQGGDIFYTFER